MAASLILYGQLAEDTARWRQNGKESSLLYRGVQCLAGSALTDQSLTRQQRVDYSGN